MNEYTVTWGGIDPITRTYIDSIFEEKFPSLEEALYAAPARENELVPLTHPDVNFLDIFTEEELNHREDMDIEISGADVFYNDGTSEQSVASLGF